MKIKKLFTFPIAISLMSGSLFSMPFMITSCGHDQSEENEIDASHLRIEDSILEGFNGEWEQSWGSKLLVPIGVTSIANLAFENALGITQLILSDSVNKIGNYSFENCLHIWKIDLDMVEDIGEDAFAKCPNLKTVTLDENNSSFNLYDENGAAVTGSNRKINNGFMQKVGWCPPGEIAPLGSESCVALGNIKIPNDIVIINELTFKMCFSITSIDLNNVESVESAAFAWCTNLNNINLSKTEDLGNGCFVNCSSINRISVTDNEYYDLYDGLGNLIVGSNQYITKNGFVRSHFDDPTDITTICNDATGVGGGLAIGSITIPTGVTIIAGGAFQECTSIKGTVFFNDVQRIVQYAFDGCDGIKEINLNQINWIDDGGFIVHGVVSIIGNYPKGFDFSNFDANALNVSNSGIVSNQLDEDKNMSSADLLSILKTKGVPSAWSWS